MLYISKHILILFSPAVCVPVVRIVVFEYKCMHVVFEYKCMRTRIFLETCLKQSIFTYKGMHVYAQEYNTLRLYWTICSDFFTMCAMLPSLGQFWRWGLFHNNWGHHSPILKHSILIVMYVTYTIYYSTNCSDFVYVWGGGGLSDGCGD